MGTGAAALSRVPCPSRLVAAGKPLTPVFAMNEQHPSVSAVGMHMDQMVEVAVLAQWYYEEEGRSEGRSLDHWLRAERELQPHAVEHAPERQPTREERLAEEAMLLGR